MAREFTDERRAFLSDTACGTRRAPARARGRPGVRRDLSHHGAVREGAARAGLGLHSDRSNGARGQRSDHGDPAVRSVQRDVLDAEKRAFLERTGAPGVLKPFDVEEARRLVHQVFTGVQPLRPARRGQEPSHGEITLRDRWGNMGSESLRE